MGEVPFRKLTLTDVERAVDHSKYRIECASLRAIQYLTDPKKKERLASCECVICYYGDRIGGAAMTRAFCGICRRDTMYSSTSTDKTCRECAARMGLCKHCGGTQDLKIPRSLREVMNEFARQDESLPNSQPG